MTFSILHSEPKYQQLALLLRRKIKDGRFRPGQPLPSEPQLVQTHGVSRATVREAINLLMHEGLVLRRQGKGTFVHQPIRAAATATYIAAYSNLCSLTHPYLSQVLHGIQQGLDEIKAGVQCIAFGNTLLHDRDALVQAALQSGCCQGVFLLSPLPMKEVQELLIWKGIPVIALGLGYEALNFPSLNVDVRHVASLLLDHLQSLDHHHVALITAPDGHSERFHLFAKDLFLAEAERRMREGAIECPAASLVECRDYNANLGYEATRSILQQPAPPTAIVALDDFLALGACQAARDLGLDVPQDVSITGMGDYLTGSNLTTVHFPLEELGRASVQFLSAAGQHAPPSLLPPYFEAKFIVRGSTGPCVIRS